MINAVDVLRGTRRGRDGLSEVLDESAEGVGVVGALAEEVAIVLEEALESGGLFWFDSFSGHLKNQIMDAKGRRVKGCSVRFYDNT